ncbi:MAG TPA: MraY family glycosyltransferase [Chthonomonadaceae bacterium]|nr:MraY family glycosyltransferase [Chthonomonadaceae bacterium]
MTAPVIAVAGLLVATTCVSAALTRGMIALAHARGWVVRPKADRWSKMPTAVFGGVAMFAAYATGAAIAMGALDTAQRYDLIGLFTGALILFIVGVRDDAKPLNPQVKLMGQVLAIMPFLVGAGLAFTSTTFVISIPLVLFWMLALTNAFNLLDNMDGLSAGTAAVAGAAIGAYALLHHNTTVGALALLVSAACAGFLVFNRPARGPARIFMGDCGSMFLGYMLSGLAVIAFCPTAPMPIHVMAAQCLLPILIMAAPIFDTTLVTIIRKREGRAISQGGRDHSSHRLVYSGRSDRQAVLLIWGVGALGGGAAVLLGQVHNSALVFAAVTAEIALLTWLGSYLSHFREAPNSAMRPMARTDNVEGGQQRLVEAASQSDRN